MTNLDELLDSEAAKFSPTDDEVRDAFAAVVSRRSSIRNLPLPASAERHGAEEAPPSRGKRIVFTGLIAAACLVVGGIAGAASQPSEDEIAERYGLTPLAWPDAAVGTATADGLRINGTLVDDPNCKGAEGKVTVLQEVEGDRIYCITADTQMEAWIIGQRLLGKDPTDAEIAEMREALAD